MYLHILPEMICYPVSAQLPCLFSLSPISECMSVCQDYRGQTDKWMSHNYHAKHATTRCNIIMPVRKYIKQ